MASRFFSPHGHDLTSDDDILTDICIRAVVSTMFALGMRNSSVALFIDVQDYNNIKKPTCAYIVFLELENFLLCAV